jgi:hypothetical protein
MHKRRYSDKHHLVIPRTFIHDDIKEKHDPVYTAQPGVKRTYDMISLSYLWPGMGRYIEYYIKHVIRAKEQRRTKNL